LIFESKAKSATGSTGVKEVWMKELLLLLCTEMVLALFSLSLKLWILFRATQCLKLKNNVASKILSMVAGQALADLCWLWVTSMEERREIWHDGDDTTWRRVTDGWHGMSQLGLTDWCRCLLIFKNYLTHSC
jgi:hypothetical protein